MSEHPNLNLSPDERRLFGQLFSAADTDNIGVVTGEVAVKFFEKTRLPPTVLGEVGNRHESVFGVLGLMQHLGRYGKSQIPRTEDSLLLQALGLCYG